jgi:hypothetical protein
MLAAAGAGAVEAEGPAHSGRSAGGGAGRARGWRIRLPARDLRRQPYDFEVRAAVDFAQIDTAYATVVQQIHDLFARKWLPAQMAELRDAILYTATGKARVRASQRPTWRRSRLPLPGQDELADLLFTAAEQGANAHTLNSRRRASRPAKPPRPRSALR